MQNKTCFGCLVKLLDTLTDFQRKKKAENHSLFFLFANKNLTLRRYYANEWIESLNTRRGNEMEKEPYFLTLLSEMKERFYQRKEFYELASKYGDAPYLVGRMKARGEIVELLGWQYFAKKDFFERFTLELEKKEPEEMESMLRDKGVTEEDLPNMMAFFRGYFGIENR